MDEAAAVLLKRCSHIHGARREAPYRELRLARVDRDRASEEGVQPAPPPSSGLRLGARGHGGVRGGRHRTNRTVPSVRRLRPSEPASGHDRSGVRAPTCPIGQRFPR